MTKAMSFLAAFLWSLVGLLAGVVLGLVAGVSAKFVFLGATLGLAIGWFGFSGTYGRLNGRSKPVRLAREALTEGEARTWLDDFLVRQQQK